MSTTDTTTQSMRRTFRGMSTLVLGPARVFWTLLIGLAIFNFFLFVVVNTMGWTEGFTGKPGFNWVHFGAVMNGSINLGFVLGLVVVLAVLAFLFWGVRRLSDKGHHGWVAGIAVLAVLFGVLAASAGWFKLSILNAGLPILIFVLFTALEAIILTTVLAFLGKDKTLNS